MTQSAVRELSWKPVRRGAIYCAPACGGSCTYEAFMAANSKAAILCRKLSKGWTSSVHENLGWHYCVVSPCRRIRVHEYSQTSYSAFICDRGDVGGRYVGEGRIPQKAIDNAVTKAKADLARIGAYIEGL